MAKAIAFVDIDPRRKFILTHMVVQNPSVHSALATICSNHSAAAIVVVDSDRRQDFIIAHLVAQNLAMGLAYAAVRRMAAALIFVDNEFR